MNSSHYFHLIVIVIARYVNYDPYQLHIIILSLSLNFITHIFTAIICLSYTCTMYTAFLKMNLKMIKQQFVTFFRLQYVCLICAEMFLN